MAQHSAPSRLRKTAIWVARIVLAAVFGTAGFMKLTQPIPVLTANMVWPGDLPVALVRAIGACELLGAIGLVLPSAIGMGRDLMRWAAIGLLTVMLLAVPFHITRGEFSVVPVNLVLGALAGFIAWKPR